MDTVSREVRSCIMSSIRSVSRLELEARPLLKGYRLRHQPKGVKGKPDYANKSRRLAVYINGCFFHGHSCSRLPKSNTAFWRKKIEGNRKRDSRSVAALRRDGWKVAVLWECQIRFALKGML